MRRRSFIRQSATVLAGLLLPGFGWSSTLRSTHDIYNIGIRKGMLGRGRIVGHLQIIADDSRYCISVWAEEISKKLLFLPIGKDTEEEAMDLILDEEHVNPLRITFTAFGRLNGDALVSEGIIVTDKKDGSIVSQLSIEETGKGGTLARYSTIGHGSVSRAFESRLTDPLTGLVSIGRGQARVPTISVRTRENQIGLSSRILSATSMQGEYVMLRTRPDNVGRFWDFRSDTRLQYSEDRISRMKIDRYNLFSSIDIRHHRAAPLVDLRLDHVYAGRL